MGMAMDVAESNLLQQIAETLQDHRALIARLKSLVEDTEKDDHPNSNE